jgi:hypothetical protein
VRERAVRRGRDDRRERRTFRARVLHEANQLDRDLALGAPGEPALAQRLVRGGGELGRGPHRGDLGRILERAQLLD